MFKRQHFIAFVAVVGLVLILLNLPGAVGARLKFSLSGFFLPLFGLAGSTQTLTEKAGNAVVPRRVLLQQIEKLEQENQQLRFQAAQTTQIWQENTQLRQAVQWQQKTPWKLKLARVILRDPANWWRSLHINLGAADGVQTNMAVLVENGLVGKISHVGPTSAQVVLVGDPSCRLSAMVLGETRDTGILSSASLTVLEPSIVNLSYLHRGSTAKAGDKVVTSGLGGIFPQGIPIGQVVETTSVGYGLYTEARVKLSADINHLEEVWVLFP